MADEPPVEGTPRPRSALGSAGFAVATQTGMRVIGFVSVAVFARLLSPEDFGLMALAAAASQLPQMLVFTGVRPALVRAEAPSRAELQAGWTIDFIARAAAAAMIVLFAAPIGAAAFDAREVGVVTAAMAGSVLVTGLQNIGTVAAERRMEYDRLMVLRLSSRLFGLVVGVAAAVILRNVWALVISAFATNLAQALSSYLIDPVPPRFSLKGVRRLASSWGPVFVAGLSNSARLIAERAVAGMSAATAAVGYYAVSQDFTRLIVKEPAGAATRVMLPYLSRAKGDQGAATWALLQLVGAMAVVVAPLAFGLAATAREATAIALGPQWADAARFMPVMAAAAAFGAVAAMLTPVAVGLGRERVLVRIELAHLASLCPVAYVAASTGGLYALAVALAALGGVFAAVRLAAIAVFAAAPFARIGAALTRPVLAAATMVAVLSAAPEPDNVFLSALLKMAVGGAVYAAVLLVLWRAAGAPDGGERFALSKLQAIARRLDRRGAARA